MLSVSLSARPIQIKEVIDLAITHVSRLRYNESGRIYILYGFSIKLTASKNNKRVFNGSQAGLLIVGVYNSIRNILAMLHNPIC